jgi:hypothetical protein
VTLLRRPRCRVAPKHGRQVLSKEEQELNCAQKQADPTHHVCDDRQEFERPETAQGFKTKGAKAS